MKITQFFAMILVGMLGISLIDDYTRSFTQFEGSNLFGVFRVLLLAVLSFVRGYQVHKHKEISKELDL